MHSDIHVSIVILWSMFSLGSDQPLFFDPLLFCTAPLQSLRKRRVAGQQKEAGAVRIIQWSDLK